MPTSTWFVYVNFEHINDKKKQTAKIPALSPIKAACIATDIVNHEFDFSPHLSELSAGESDWSIDDWIIRNISLYNAHEYQNH